MEKLVWEREVACVPWSEVPFTYIRDECHGTKFAKQQSTHQIGCSFLTGMIDNGGGDILSSRIFIIRNPSLWHQDPVAHTFFIGDSSFCQVIIHHDSLGGSLRLELDFARSSTQLGSSTHHGSFTRLGALLGLELCSAWSFARLGALLSLELCLARSSTQPKWNLS